MNGGPGRGNGSGDVRLANGHIAEDVEDDAVMQLVTGATELSQRELIARAFAGDDVQAEFAEEKVCMHAQSHHVEALYHHRPDLSWKSPRYECTPNM